MPELKINGYTFATQADGNNPVLASNVNLGSATFPAGHIIQIPTDATLNILSGSTSLTNSYQTYLSHSVNVTSGNDILVMVSISRLKLNGGTSWDGPSGFVKLTDTTSDITQEYFFFQRDNLSSTKYIDIPISINAIYTPSTTSQTFNLQMKYGNTATSAEVYGVRMTLMEIQR